MYRAVETAPSTQKRRPLLIIQLVQKIVLEIFNIISSDTHFRIFNLILLLQASPTSRKGSPCHALMTPKYQKTKNTLH